MTGMAEGAEAQRRWLATWQQVADGYLGGIQHALNNRVAALSAVAQVMAAGAPEGGALEQALVYEVQRLQGAVGYLNFLRRGRIGGAEPIELPLLLVGLTDLCSHHTEMRETRYDVGGDAGVLPLYAEPGLLNRALLVLLTAAGLRSQAAGQSTVAVRYAGDESFVTISAGDGAPTESAGEESDGTSTHIDPAALEWPVTEMGGEVIRGGDGELAIRLPTLLEVRRRERSGS